MARERGSCDPSWLTIRVSGPGRHCDQQVRGSRVPVWRTNPGRSQRRCVRQSPAYGTGGQEVARAGAFRVHRGHRHTEIHVALCTGAQRRCRHGVVVVPGAHCSCLAGTDRSGTAVTVAGHRRRDRHQDRGRLVIDHGQGQLSRSEVTEAEAPHRLTMTWEFPDEPRSRVAVELRESDEGAAAKLTHTGPDLAASYGPGWTTHLTYLEAAVQGETTPPSQFWKLYATFAALRNERASIP